VTDLVHAALVVGALLLIMRLALGGTFWKRDGRFNLLKPSRDRDYTRGGFLAVMALWGLAEVGDASSPGEGTISTALTLSFIAAGLYAVNRDLTGAGLGIIGTVALLLGRHTSECISYTTQDNVRFWVGAAVTFVVLLLLRVVLTPVRAAVTVTASLSLLAPAPTRGRPSIFFAMFGMLSLLNLATRPGVLELPDQWSGATIGVAVIWVAALGALAVALTVLPNFTLSVLSLGTFAATLYVDGVLYSCTSGTQWQTRLVLLACFMVVTWVVGWVFKRS
jgi:hypothetical protein